MKVTGPGCGERACRAGSYLSSGAATQDQALDDTELFGEDETSSGHPWGHRVLSIWVTKYRRVSGKGLE